MVEFTIFGNPQAQKRHRHFRLGTYDPSKKDKQNFYLQALKHKPKTTLSGKIFIDISFYMARPKSHFRTGKYKNILKDDAPKYYQSKKPDIDNLVKLVFDSLSGKDRFIKDDAMVCSLKAEKIYADEYPRTKVKLFALQN